MYLDDWAKMVVAEWSLSVRFKEHCKLYRPTRVGKHCNTTGHSVYMDNLKVLDREQDWMKRKEGGRRPST